MVNDGGKEMTEMIDAKPDLKPCPFCGTKDKVRENGKNYQIWCINDECPGAEFICKDKWQNAYCWKRIEQLEADYSSEIQAKELAQERVIALEKELATAKELSELRFQALCREQKKNWIIKQRMSELNKGVKP